MVCLTLVYQLISSKIFYLFEVSWCYLSTTPVEFNAAWRLWVTILPPAQMKDVVDGYSTVKIRNNFTVLS